MQLPCIHCWICSSPGHVHAACSVGNMHGWLRLIGITSMLPVGGVLAATVLPAPQHGAAGMHEEAHTVLISYIGLNITCYVTPRNMSPDDA